MDIAQMRIDTLHDFTVDYCLQAEHTVSTRVLGTDVDDIVVITKQAVLLRLESSAVVDKILQAVVGFNIVFKRIFARSLEVLAQGPSLEIVSEEQAAHILVAEEDDTQEVEHLTLKQVGTLPKIGNGRDIIQGLAVGVARAVNGISVAAHLSAGNHLHRAALVRLRILQNIDTTQALFAEVLAHYGDEIVEMLLLLEVCHLGGKLIEIEY